MRLFVSLMWSAAALVVFAAPLKGQSALADRVVGPFGGRDLTILLPAATGGGFESAVIQATASTKVAVGLERVMAELPVLEIDGTKTIQRGTLTGRTLRDVLNELITGPPALPPPGYWFRWREDGGIIHVTPFERGATFLDTPVADFSLSDASLANVLVAVHRLFDPGFPAPAATASGRAVTLSLQKTTVRAILDATALAHGGLSWVVRYRSSTGAYTGCEIAFVEQSELRFASVSARQ